MSSPLVQARRTSLAQSTPSLPQVSSAVWSFLQPVCIGIVQSSMIDGYNQEVILNRLTSAARQPLAENLAIRKEGDRSWRWHVIHMTPEIVLKTNDEIILHEVRYRIMQKFDWKEYGYCEYHAIETYKAEN